MMNQKLKDKSILLIFLLFTLLSVNSLFAEENTIIIDEQHPFVVKNLRVTDVPHDNGTGLRITWEPLPFEARVISYRIYRGTSPDTLFFIGELPINPNIELATSQMTFYDRDLTMFVDITHPGRLRRERGQPADSPLFRRVPRDVGIIGQMINDYSLVAVIPKDNFYFKTTRIEKDGIFYAGIGPNQLNIAKELLPGRPYYYTVAAINERRVYYPPAPAVAGIPINDIPEPPAELFSVYVEDTNTLQFEWRQAIYREDLRFYIIYAVENSNINAFMEWHNRYKEIDEEFDIWKEDLTAQTEGIYEQIRQFTDRRREHVNNLPATWIYHYQRAMPFVPTTYAKIELDGNQIITDNDAFLGTRHNAFTFNGDINDYRFILSYMDTEEKQSFSELSEIRYVDSSALPILGEINIFDQKDDKGDYFELNWGKPFVRISSVTYLNNARTRLQVNYEHSTNKNYKIRNIYFEIYDNENNYLMTINEFFQDGVIKFNLPQNIDQNELNIKMYFRTREDGLDKEHYVTQRLVFDETILTLRPQELHFNGFVVENLDFQILKRTRFNPSFRSSKKVPAFDRETNDLIAYEVNVFKALTDFCLNSNKFLVDQDIDLIYDTPRRTHINVPIFATDKDNVITNLQFLLDERQERYDNTNDENEKNEHRMYIDWYQRRITSHERLIGAIETTERIEELQGLKHEANLRLEETTDLDERELLISEISGYQSEIDTEMDLIQANEVMSYINGISNQRHRAREIRRYREIERREFTYLMLLSNGEGLFTLKNVGLENSETPIYMIPESNWFNTTRIPTLIASLIFALLVSIFIKVAKRGKDLYIRPIAGIEEIDNAIGRATEMGRPILFCPGLSGISDVATLAGLAILGHVAKKAVEYDTKILVPNRDVIVLPIAREIVREAHSIAGRPDSFDVNSVFFVSDQQFAYVAGVNGVMVREKTATNFYMGMFFAESLIMTETGNATGAIQIAGTDAVTQIPFFITTCDYTLIGEELYAASAYMARQPLQMGTLKAQDYAKFIILTFLVVGTILSSFQITEIIELFPYR